MRHIYGTCGFDLIFPNDPLTTVQNWKSADQYISTVIETWILAHARFSPIGDRPLRKILKGCISRGIEIGLISEAVSVVVSQKRAKIVVVPVAGALASCQHPDIHRF